ncbi:hypothetical protein ACH5RR_030372 [Cinchona calisaya]|uniref:Transposase MuDR plant domain-containing protein n=1 Tax=Cinchona calisaya TaxID=153742 RepID=A0ABD2YWK7_9GENT
MFKLEIHHHGGIIMNPEPKYIGGPIDYITEFDPDLMSLIELKEIVKGLELPENTPMSYIAVGGELRLITSNEIVLKMFGLFRGSSYIVIYVGELMAENVHVENRVVANDQVEANEGNSEGVVKNPEMENANIENEGSGDSLASSDESDNTYDAEGENSSDNESDLQYFLDGDSLSDACGPLEEGEVVDGFGLNVDLWDFSAYAMMISEDYTSYMNAKSQGKVVEYENVSDNEILDAAPNSSDDEDGNGIPEFKEDRDMDNLDMNVGLIFSTVQLYRKALRLYSIRKGFELKFIKNDSDRVIAICERECGWRIHASYFRGSTALQVKSSEGMPHTCPWAYRNKSGCPKNSLGS